MDLKELAKKLDKKFPNEPYSIVHGGEKSNDITILKCLQCGRKIRAKNSYWFSKKKKHICSKCSYKRKDTERNEKIILDKLKGKATDIRFYMEDTKGIRHHMVDFTCTKCGRVNTKRISNFLKEKYNCSYCEGAKKGKDNDAFIFELRNKYGNKFTLLSEYENVNTSIKIKCNNCGFIRKVKPRAILESGFCPKCDTRLSKGEKVISSFLEQRGIKYETQKYFREWGIGIHYFDFFIPQYNLVIEYNGRQHYEFVQHFHKTQKEFEYRLEKDRVKKQAALDQNLNYVSINHLLFNHLDQILEKIFDSTTIPIGSKGKCLEIETIQFLDEDIVCSSLKGEERK